MLPPACVNTVRVCRLFFNFGKHLPSKDVFWCLMHEIKSIRSLSLFATLPKKPFMLIFKSQSRNWIPVQTAHYARQTRRLLFVLNKCWLILKRFDWYVQEWRFIHVWPCSLHNKKRGRHLQQNVKLSKTTISHLIYIDMSTVFQTTHVRFSCLVWLEAAGEESLLVLEARLGMKGVSWRTILVATLMVPTEAMEVDPSEEN